MRGREGSSQHLVCFLEELDGIRSPVKAGLGRARFHGTKSGKPIGQQPLARHKVEQIRAELQKGTGIIKTRGCAGLVYLQCSASSGRWRRDEQPDEAGPTAGLTWAHLVQQLLDFATLLAAGADPGAIAPPLL